MSTAPQRTLPHNLEAERSVLGGILIDNEQYHTAAAIMRPEHHFRDAHKRIHEGLERLVEKKSPLDMVTLKEELERKGDLEEVGGAAYIASLVDGVPRSTNVEYYAGIVLEKWKAREVIFRSNKTLAAAYEHEADVADIIGEGVANLVDISTQGTRGALVAGDVLAKEMLSWLEEIEHRTRRSDILGYPTGLTAIDHMTDGLQPGELSIFAARPSQGKTAAGLQIALYPLIAGINDASSIFFSLEMKRHKLTARAVAALAQVDGWAMRRGRLTSDEYARVAHALELFSQQKRFAIDDSPGLTVAAIRAKARQWQLRHGLKLIVVDYLTLLTPRARKGRDSNREREVAEMAQGLKEIARELGVHVMALAQLNRLIEGRADREPMLSDLRESGAIEQIADLIMFIHREKGQTVADEGKVEIIIAKQRDGPIGRRSFMWIPSQTRFAPYTT